MFSQLFTTKAQSLLLMTSVAMPVFSKKKETVGVWFITLLLTCISWITAVSERITCVLRLQLSHGILLGVVGSDIPLMEVMKLAPRYMVSSWASSSCCCCFFSELHFTDSSSSSSSSSAGSSWLRLPHHQQRLHPGPPRPPTSGERCCLWTLGLNICTSQI